MGLFQIKSDGRTPRPLDSLQFTFDALQYFTRPQEQSPFLGGQAAPVGSSATLFTVPAGKGWLVTGASILSVTSAAQYYRGRLVAQLNLNSFTQYSITEEAYSSILGVVAVGSAQANMPVGQALLLPPASAIVIWTAQNLGAAVCNVGIRYVEFPWS